MDDPPSHELRALIERAIAKCEALGETIPAAHLQLGLDLLRTERRLREPSRPWGASEEPPLPKAEPGAAGDD